MSDEPINVIRITQEGNDDKKEFATKKYILLCLDADNRQVISNVGSTFDTCCTLQDAALSMLGRPASIETLKALTQEVRLLREQVNELRNPATGDD